MKRARRRMNRPDVTLQRTAGNRATTALIQHAPEGASATGYIQSLIAEAARRAQGRTPYPRKKARTAKASSVSRAARRSTSVWRLLMLHRVAAPST